MTRARLIALIAVLLVVLSQIPLNPPTIDAKGRESRESQAIVGNGACNPRVKICEIDLLVSAAPVRSVAPASLEDVPSDASDNALDGAPNSAPDHASDDAPNNAPGK